ncbi:hypothetical protein O181_084133 [Austropuccinia psidii MF-1]|uniref:Reverse transcriptase domain-containing protein n=1 Tax=Austropuccinia psidii MF-1 TaxID=1389203 RepID=A0A9Q3IKB1_9BASI|nr:hypothetical protein [Austropuccinia psidii MF-1]
MDVIRKIRHNEIVEITTPVLIPWHDGKSRLCGDFRALNNYTKADRYPITRIPHALDKLAKAKYITTMDCMKGFHQNRVKPNSMKLLRIICLMGIYEYTRMPFGIKNTPAHFQSMMDTIFQEEILEGWMVVYIDDIIIYSQTWEDHVQYIDRVLSKWIPINLKVSLKKCNFGQQELLALGHKVSGLSLEIDQNKIAELRQKPVPRNIKEMQSFLGFASYYRKYIKTFAHITSSLYKLCSKDVVFETTKERRDSYERQGLGAALHQRQIVDGEPIKGVICYIYRQLKDSEARYGDTQTECLCLVWALEKLYYYLEGAVFEVYTDCTALKFLLNMKATKRHMLRWQRAIQEYRGNMTIIYKEDRKKNSRFSEWAPESGTPDSGDTDSEGTETPILGISSSELHNEFFNAVMNTYSKHKQCGILLQLLQQKYRTPELQYQLEEPWLRDYKDNKFFLIDGLLPHREKHTSALTIIDRDHIYLIL